MEAPGLSLFQGSEGIQLNAGAQRPEEEEEQEDIKRRNEEIKNLLTNAFDDLEDDEASSINSSRYEDVTRDSEHSHSMMTSSFQPTQSDGGPTISQFQREFAGYGRMDQTNNYNQNANPPFHQTETDSGPTVSEIQREFGVYGQAASPYNKNNQINDDTDHRSPETPYELPKPPTPGFQHNLRAQLNEEFTFNHNYPNNYGTPANHYEGQNNSYPNNGYIDGYENNVQYKPIRDFGGGDNDVSLEHLNHCYKTSPNGRPIDDNMAYKTAEYNSKEQLEVLYSVRMREIQRLTEELQQLQMEKEEEKMQISRKLALAQAEVERSNLSRNQAQNLLVNAKAEIADLQSQVSSLKDNISVLEKTKENMVEDLSVAKGSVVDLQQKIAVLERVQALQSSDKTHEKFLKQAQEKHAVEMKNMQTQIDALMDKLNAKETANVALEHKLADVRRAHETLMVEKGDTMNRLAQALEESQSHCRHLMASNNAQEVMQLQTQLKVATQEKEELAKKVQELQHKLELAKSDITQYDSLLATTLEEESDSMRQLKLGELQNKSRSKPCDDITNKLRGELQRCLAGQAVKRKEINRLENTLAQKQKEMEKATSLAQTCREEAAKYAKRVSELEQELKSLLTEKAIQANAEIQKLSNHLNDTKKQCEALKKERDELERKLEESLSVNRETMRQLHEESTAQKEREIVGEYNKEYLEIHDKAVERVRQEAQVDIVQLSVQLEQTQKELDRVKELYIDVCGTKEQLISQHKDEIEALKGTYADLESRKQDLEKTTKDLETQMKVTERLTKECEMYRSKIVELEKDLGHERKRREEHAKRIHVEIERAKEEALEELRNAHPNQSINVNLPDHCSEHLDKITQLEDDCKRLENKLSSAVEEQRRMSGLQNELDNARLKVAQMEIAHESLRKKYENIMSERKDFQTKTSTLESELSAAKKNNSSKTEESDDTKLRIARMQIDNESLKNKYDIMVSDRNTCKEKISKLENELSQMRKTVANLESKLRRTSELSQSSKKIDELERELSQYKDMVSQLTVKLNEIQKGRRSDINLEERVKQLEKDVQGKEEKLQRLRDLERIKEERDQLVLKLKNQAKQFEQYVKSQKQVSAELNLSPRSLSDGTDLQKIKERTIKEVREEMEQKVAEELKGIEEQHRQKQKEIEEKYKGLLLELQARCEEKTKEVEAMKETMNVERMKLHSAFRTQEQVVAKMIESKLETLHSELVARKVRIDQLQEELKQKVNDVEEERDVMAQVMSEWAAEIRDIKAKEIEMNEEIRKLKQSEENLTSEVKDLKEKEIEMKNSVDMLKHKYQSAKKTAHNYKEYADNKEKFLLSECKRIEEGYKRAMNQVQQKIDVIVSTQEERVATKLKELESQYEEQLEQMRLKMKYKSKC